MVVVVRVSNDEISLVTEDVTCDNGGSGGGDCSCSSLTDIGSCRDLKKLARNFKLFSANSVTGDGANFGFGGTTGGALIPGIMLIVQTEEASPASFLAVILYSPACLVASTVSEVYR